MARIEPLIVKVDGKNLIALIEEVNKLTDTVKSMYETIKHNKQVIQEQQVVLIGLTKLVKSHELLLNAEIPLNPFSNTPQESAAKRLKDSAIA